MILQVYYNRSVKCFDGDNWFILRELGMEAGANAVRVPWLSPFIHQTSHSQLTHTPFVPFVGVCEVPIMCYWVFCWESILVVGVLLVP